MPKTQLVNHTATPSTGSGEVLFALTANERRRFFPDGPGPRFANSAWAEIENMSPEAWVGAVRKLAPRVLVSCWATPSLPTELTIAGGGSVEYVCQISGSVRHVVAREAIVGGLKVSNWGSLVAPLVAEHALLLILAQARNLTAWRDFIGQLPKRRSEWDLATRTLHGKRVAIHGFGAIARALVELLGPFKTDVRVFSHGVPAAVIKQHGLKATSSLHELCAGAEIFVCCEALTAATRGSIDASVLECLAPGTIFVNVARGALVDESALLEATRRMGLRVASDVFCHEPISADLPFLSLPGTLVSPHIGGPTHDFYPVCGAYALANIDFHQRGAPLLSPVTLEVFDRST